MEEPFVVSISLPLSFFFFFSSSPLLASVKGTQERSRTRSLLSLPLSFSFSLSLSLSQGGWGLHTRARSCRVALYFHFRCFPRGAVSPYIYLIAAPPDRELFSYTEDRFTAAAYSSAHFAPPLYGQFPFPLSRVLQIIKSSLRED